MIPHYLVAGTCAGVITSILLQPLDLIKVRFQVQDGRNVPVQYRGVAQAAAQVWRAEGLPGFYRGLVPAAWGSGASWGLYFFFYENCKQRMTRRMETSGSPSGGVQLSTVQHMYAAWEGGTLTCLFTNPLWLVKTRLQLQTGSIGARDARNYAGMTDALISIVKEEGVLGLYRGLVPALLLTSHGMVQFAVYEELKLRFASSPTPTTLPSASPAQSSSSSSSLNTGNPPVLFAIGAVSKAIATTATYPYQVIKARLQQRSTPAGERLYTGLVNTCTKIARGEGARGFYKGFAANLLRVAPQSAITLMAYEYIMAFLSSEG